MKTFLDWSAYRDSGLGDPYADIPRTGGDFARAVAVCISSRGCESRDGKGVMCPSYRVSGTGNHSTGGRVRLLKTALNGELGDAPFTAPDLAEAMDLCVSCKGCRRECENEVDMALIKVEYLAQRNVRTGVSLRSRLFATLPLWLYRWPAGKRLFHWRNRFPWLAALGERLLGITARTRLPEPVPREFCLLSADVAGVAPSPDTEGKGREVVLWVDTFTRYFEPDIAHAALEVLNAAGYRTFLAEAGAAVAEPGRPLCCGRTFLAQGMIAEARAEARRVLAALLPHVEAGRPIVGLEPSCLLTLRDEYKALGLGEDALRVGRQALLLEEFIAREHTAKTLNLPLAPMHGAPSILVHGHCHQKAAGAMKSMRKVLKLIPDLRFELVEASCCGMAGSFGLEAEHAAVSSAMAEQALSPGLRAEPEATVVANGFSCRQQILGNGLRPPVHLAQLLRDVLPGSARGGDRG